MSLKDNSCNLCVYLSFPQSIKFKSSLLLLAEPGIVFATLTARTSNGGGG